MEQSAPEPALHVAAAGGGSVKALSAAAAHPAHMPHVDAEGGGPVRLRDLYVRLGE